MSVERFGWKFLSSQSLLTDTGMHLDLACDSPAFVMQQVTETVRRNIAREVDTQYPTLESGGKGPITAGFRKALRSAKNLTRTNGLWSRKCRSAFISATSNGQWTQDRLVRAGLSKCTHLQIMCQR